MLNYSSPFTSGPVVSEQQRQAAMAGMQPKSPYGIYGQNHQDLMNSIGGVNAGEYSLAADRANAEQSMQQRQAARQLALAGLTNMSAAQRNEQDLQNSRLQQITGTVGSLLGGLFS